MEKNPLSKKANKTNKQINKKPQTTRSRGSEDLRKATSDKEKFKHNLLNLTNLFYI